MVVESAQGIGEIVALPDGSELRQANPALIDGQGEIIRPEGGISTNDIQSVLAFNNGLSLVDLTAIELANLLEGSVYPYPTPDGRFVQVAGLRFSFDPSMPPTDPANPNQLSLSRVRSVWITLEDLSVEQIVDGGVLVVDGTKRYRAVTLDFEVDGGNFVLSNLQHPNRFDLYDIDGNGVDDGFLTGVATFTEDGTEQDALAEYLAATFPSSSLPFSMEDGGPNQDVRIQNLDFRMEEAPGDMLSEEPTELPSEAPSSVPSFTPSDRPTRLSSGIPSASPSAVPSPITENGCNCKMNVLFILCWFFRCLLGLW